MNKFDTYKALTSIYSANVVTFCQTIDLCRQDMDEPLLHTKRVRHAVGMSKDLPMTTLCSHIDSLVEMLQLVRPGLLESKYIPSLMSIYLVPLMTTIITTLASGLIVYMKSESDLSETEVEAINGYINRLHTPELSEIAQQAIVNAGLANALTCIDRITEDATYITSRMGDLELLRSGVKKIH